MMMSVTYVLSRCLAANSSSNELANTECEEVVDEQCKQVVPEAIVPESNHPVEDDPKDQRANGNEWDLGQGDCPNKRRQAVGVPERKETKTNEARRREATEDEWRERRHTHT